MRNVNSIIITFLFLLLGMCPKVEAQIQSLDKLNKTHTYLLENANGYGYCVYNKELAYSDYYSSMYLTLGGATVDHPDGCANEAFRKPIDPANKNNQWKIQKQNDGSYYLLNVGQNLYATNENEVSWGGWGGNNTQQLNGWVLSSKAFAVDIETYADGIFTFRKKASTDDTRYMCAAGWESMAIANWKNTDMGSQWRIIDTETNTIKVSSITLSETSILMNTGETFELKAAIQPQNATLKTIAWSSTNENVATIKEGTITALRPGITTIVAKAMDASGVEAKCTVTVSTPNEEYTNESLGTIHYYTLHDGTLMAIPEKYITGKQDDGNYLSLTLTGDTTIAIAHGNLASEDTIYVGDLPTFESFKFNNKFNDQLFTDVDGIINDSLSRIDLTVSCIGKRLTPSFKIPDGAHAFVDGKAQISKRTSHRFDQDLLYTIAYPKNYIYKVRKLSDAVYQNPETADADEQWICTPVALTAEMLSTNAPSNVGEDPANLLDGNTNTIFHTTWGTGAYTKLAWSEGATYGDGVSEWPYLQIDLPESLSALKFSYITRNTGDYAPRGFIIQGSNNGTDWDDAYELNDKDNLPMGTNETYTSAVISLGQEYKHLRLQMTAASHKNYLVMSEFSLWKVTENPDYNIDGPTEPILITPAKYETTFVPYGREYRVHVNYRTDAPTAEYNVPIIRINTYDGTMINSKTRYWDASFELDGAGVWDNIRVDSMQIRGRGNSSWSNSTTSKNPYRLKFNSKIKPFGLTKGKNWVLLANKQTGSMTTNAIAMKLADMVGSEACNHIIPVELYINGDYRGSYNFTEKVGFANNSINLDDETNACLLELDSYYDEAYKFRDASYNLYVNVKEPDFSDPQTITNLSMSDIQESFNYMTAALKRGKEYSYQIDANSIATAMFVNDFVRNTECMHPKSWYLYNEDVLADSIWKLGPVWDFDWSFGYEGNYSYFIMNAESDLFQGMSSSNIGYPFFSALLRNSSVVREAYYRVWTNFLNNEGMLKLMEWCDDYLEYANPSFVHNASKWSDGKAYAAQTANAKNWLSKRANYIYSHLETFPIEQPEPPYEYEQPDRIDLADIMSRLVDVYTISGVRVRSQVPYSQFTQGLVPGIYIVGGQKIVVK